MAQHVLLLYFQVCRTDPPPQQPSGLSPTNSGKCKHNISCTGRAATTLGCAAPLQQPERHAAGSQPKAVCQVGPSQPRWHRAMASTAAATASTTASETGAPPCTAAGEGEVPAGWPAPGEGLLPAAAPLALPAGGEGLLPVAAGSALPAEGEGLPPVDAGSGDAPAAPGCWPCGLVTPISSGPPTIGPDSAALLLAMLLVVVFCAEGGWPVGCA